MGTKVTRRQAAKQSESTFGERMSIEQFLESQGCKQFDVYPRTDKPGYYYFATERGLGYVPQELGAKLENGEEHGRLFITEVTTEGYDEPMFMLCESKRESVFSFSLD